MLKKSLYGLIIIILIMSLVSCGYKCDNCKDEGVAACAQCNGNGSYDCPFCDGSGILARSSETCDYCSNGKVDCPLCYEGKMDCTDCDQ